MTPLLQPVEDALRARFAADCTGHDLHHLRRVVRVALHLQAEEGGDPVVIAHAALTHDVHRIIEHETGRYCPPEASLDEVRALLAHADLTPAQTEHVLHCVAHHEEYAFATGGRTVDDVETLILQDADNLDAIGAVGVARTFMFSGAYGIPMWRPELPLGRDGYEEAHRDPSCIHHIHAKLLRLRDAMNTPTGRAMAAERHAFMERFVETFFAEWRGER